MDLTIEKDKAVQTLNMNIEVRINEGKDPIIFKVDGKISFENTYSW